MDQPSLDPRLNRIELAPAAGYDPPGQLDHWQTFEVFHQRARGEQHVHVGCVHAPNGEMALVFAKEQFARRAQCVNLWVVKTADITVSAYEDADMFEPATDKNYREPGYYRTRDLITAYKQRQGQAVDSSGEADDMDAHAPPPLARPAAASAPAAADAGNGPSPAATPAKPKPRIILGKKKPA